MFLRPSARILRPGGVTREMLESVIDERYGELLSIMAELRPYILHQVPRDRQAALWKQLLGDQVLDCLHAEGPDQARALARAIADSFGNV